MDRKTLEIHIGAAHLVADLSEELRRERERYAELAKDARSLLSRKREGPSEDAHIFAEWDTLEDTLKRHEQERER